MPSKDPSFLARLDARPWLYLAAGTALLALSQIADAIGVLAWVAPVPFLRHVRVTRGARQRVALFAALFVGWMLAFSKIASEPFYLALAPLFCGPLALASTGALLAWDASRSRLPSALGPVAYAAAVGLGEWALPTLTPLGTWGATAYSQLENLPLLQLAAFGGVVAVGLVVSTAAAAIEHAIAELDAGRAGSGLRMLAAASGLVLAAHGLGAARLVLAGERTDERVLVAAVATDSDVRGLPLPTRETAHAWDDVLLERTRRAAAAGAALVVWPEGSTLVFPDEEAAWLENLRVTARDAGTDVVAAYIVPVSTSPLRYRNEYRLALRDGTLLPAYAKYHPVPGEPALAGTDPAPLVARPYGNLSGAICYDYDFPAMAIARARAGADLVALPASDWRGIDPVHGQMAVVRAIEGGHSLVRSTRWGLTVLADGYGRVRAWRSAFEPGPDVVLAGLPRTRIATLYARTGDVPFLAACAVLALLALRGRKRADDRPITPERDAPPQLPGRAGPADPVAVG